MITNINEIPESVRQAYTIAKDNKHLRNERWQQAMDEINEFIETNLIKSPYPNLTAARRERIRNRRQLEDKARNSPVT
jgi:hypothetical protein